ncbi:MAG: alpha/beta hydrolase [Actinomycetaceae bacterium]|nr:alpha/beta hydrolase [Arcanobacterium sp.]MDD7505274.1 alpha/beta hydrolase [Actinomycetaceae bacterium]MDY6144037.1 alpha/beta hydrolase [Arcanobacterium sp.]
MLSYYVAGEPQAPMIALVHGVCDSATAWVDLINRLQSDYFVVAFDSLGHGTSRRFTEEELADPGSATARELEATLEHLRDLYGNTPVIIAHSMGAAVSSLLSIRRPDLVCGLFLEDPAWLSDEQAAGYRERAEEQVRISTQLWQSDPATTVAQNAELRPTWDAASHIGWAFGKALVDSHLLATGIVSFLQPWREVAAQISVPTMVVTSDTDEVLIGEAGVHAIEELRNEHIETAIIPGTGHGVRLSKPDEYSAVLDQWLERFAK